MCADNVAEIIVRVPIVKVRGDGESRVPGEVGKQRKILEKEKVNEERAAEEEAECHRRES